MFKRHYVIAVVCYIAIPVVVIAGVRLSLLVDPEMARGTANYARNFQLLQTVAMSVLWSTAGLALVLWLLTCYLVLKSRQRSVLWLTLAIAGPLGFTFIAMLADRSPTPADLYQHFLRRLKLYWRVPLEIAIFISAWVLANQGVVLKRDLLISLESSSTGTPVQTIIARQNASSGMYAFGEALEEMYLVILLYLIWPIFFNFVARRFKRRTNPTP